MKTQHTQAEWQIDNTFGRPRIFVIGNPKKIILNCSADTELDEAESNAELIVRAPKLLEENEGLKEQLRLANLDKESCGKKFPS